MNINPEMGDLSYFRKKSDNYHLDNKPTTNYTVRKILPWSVAAATIIAAAALSISGCDNLFGKKK